MCIRDRLLTDSFLDYLLYERNYSEGTVRYYRTDILDDRLNTAPCQVITNAGAAADKKQAQQNKPEDLALFFIIIVAQILKHI